MKDRQHWLRKNVDIFGDANESVAIFIKDVVSIDGNWIFARKFKTSIGKSNTWRKHNTYLIFLTFLSYLRNIYEQIFHNLNT